MDNQNEQKYVRQKLVLATWSWMPGSERHPRTLADLAELLGIHVSTLARWKYSPDFLGVLRDYAPYAQADRVIDSLAELAENQHFGAIKTFLRLMKII
jgi:hypothetical protein